jgi:hypothetical protein
LAGKPGSFHSPSFRNQRRTQENRGLIGQSLHVAQYIGAFDVSLWLGKIGMGKIGTSEPNPPRWNPLNVGKK